MSTTPLLTNDVTNAVDGEGPPSTSAKKGSGRVNMDGIKSDLKGCMALSMSEWVSIATNKKNLVWVCFYILALIVGLLFVYHEAEKFDGLHGERTPLTTLFRAFISVFGLLAAGYTIYLGAKLEEQLDKFSLQNTLLEGNNRKMASSLSKFDELRAQMQEFCDAQGGKFEETFQNVSEMFDNVKVTLHDQQDVLKQQRKGNMHKLFFDFAFSDGDATMGKKEFMMASHGIPRDLRAAWTYTFETFPRASGRCATDPITLDEFTAEMEKMMSELKKSAASTTPPAQP